MSYCRRTFFALKNFKWLSNPFTNYNTTNEGKVGCTISYILMYFRKHVLNNNNKNNNIPTQRIKSMLLHIF